jgi:hypothetical protein
MKLIQALIGLAVFAVGSDIWQASGDSVMNALTGIAIMMLAVIVLTYRRGEEHGRDT